MSDVRNVTMVSSKGTGKTSLVEAMLFNAKVTKRLGRVEDGNTVSDYDPEEIARNMSLMPAICSFEYNKFRVHAIDTAGYSDFFNETRMLARISDNAIMLVSGAEGVKSQANKLWLTLDEFEVPRSVFVNSMDKELADFDQAWDSLTSTFEGAKFVPICVPVVKDKKLAGYLDLVKNKYFESQGDGSGKTLESDIPDDLSDLAEKYKEQLIETVVELNDELMERHLEGGEVSDEELSKGLHQGVASGSIVPVYGGSATQNVGVVPLMDYFLEFSADPQERPEMKGKDKNDQETTRKPSPNEPFAATVIKTTVDQYAGKTSIFKVLSGSIKADMQVEVPEKGKKLRATGLSIQCGKTQSAVSEAQVGDIVCILKAEELATGDTLCDPAHTFQLDPLKMPEPVIALAIEPKVRGDEDKLSRGLSSMLEEDPLLETRRDEQTKQLTLCGMGQVHLDSVVKRLQKRFQVDVSVSPPEIPYRETITKPSKYVEYTHKKQTGGAGQYARVFIDLEPLPRGEGYEFVDKIFGGVIDQTFRPSVDKGIQAKMAEGILAGYPVTDVRVSLVDGKTHPVDSKDIAFQIAGREVFRKAFEMSNPVLLEPVMNVEIEVPDDCMGDVIGDINSRRGRVSSTEQTPGGTVIKCSVPLAEMLRYAPDLDSMTSGRGTYSMEVGHYEEVQKRVADEIIDKYHKKKTEDDS